MSKEKMLKDLEISTKDIIINNETVEIKNICTFSLPQTAIYCMKLFKKENEEFKKEIASLNSWLQAEIFYGEELSSKKILEIAEELKERINKAIEELEYFYGKEDEAINQVIKILKGEEE